jgi:hypothetical protein
VVDPPLRQSTAPSKPDTSSASRAGAGRTAVDSLDERSERAGPLAGLDPRSTSWRNGSAGPTRRTISASRGADRAHPSGWPANKIAELKTAWKRIDDSEAEPALPRRNRAVPAFSLVSQGPGAGTRLLRETQGSPRQAQRRIGQFIEGARRTGCRKHGNHRADCPQAGGGEPAACRRGRSAPTRRILASS